ncbi:ATP-dependent Clp protease ATP-binding subunit [Hymenobacter sp. 15J16-1T3B]|uniref:ATP-dependent Clp protease ATP-binding subunit n=1 Tax=Hymenobacter sp. 15J16-1T3B TaxID=2886941 RepID=UPI001D116577|nr:ATP-dependent Clp protease ATP-binding subunit [Hymenobacter sp. 15J16-1T3B]MCC3158598.1 ATP-dependent Clp protease ATP-binding subunit [Hymenobacter sp. 15J16-1T3B]
MSYSDSLKRALHIAQAVAHEHRHPHYSAPHLLLALLHNEVGLASWLVAVLDKDIHYLREWAEVRLEEQPKAARPAESPSPDARVQQALEMAELVALQLSRDNTDPLSTLAALLKPELAFTTEQLKSLSLSQKEVLDAALQETPALAAAPAADAGSAAPSSPAPKGGALATYCTDKTAQARAGKLDPIVGRDREIRLMAEVLGRRTKPNVLLLGEPGVGKSALVEGFAQQIVQGLVPVHLREVTLFELDMGTLVAGASYKGEVEDRIKKVLGEIKQYTRAILFIDEIHVLVDPKGSAGSGIAQLLKPELARGELTVIGATTQDEYRQYIEKDEAFNRRFDVVRVEEPTITVAERMLERVLPLYAVHHNLVIGEGTIGEAVRLAKRYVKDRQLPDSAIDLVDRTMAAIRMLDEQAVAGLGQLQADFEALTARRDELEEADYLRELRWFLYQLQNQVSQLWLNQVENEQQPDALETSAELQRYLHEVLRTVLALAETRKDRVEKQDVAAIVSGKTGIPLGKLQSNEREKLLRMDQVLQKRVVGQNHAVAAICAAILESRSGLTKAGQPIGSFFLLGPTGTGKTELAKALADFLFNDESFLIRFDMSEFKEEHSAALLYGAPPGYVGYEEGGLLVNKIREKPYSVVLFDEIEKAHPSVFDIFLQILDEGHLSDRLGREGDFSNAVILFTSNIGAEQIAAAFAEGQPPASADLLETMTRYFRPEFLARLTEIVPFAPISEANVARIFDIHLRPLVEQLRRQGITLELSPAARQHLALAGFTPKYGARPITGVIRQQLRRPISRLIISGEARPGTTLALDKPADSDTLVWTTTHAEDAAPEPEAALQEAPAAVAASEPA